MQILTSHQIYEQMPNEKGTALYTAQKHFQSIFGFTLPMFHGRGILNCLSSPIPSLLAIAHCLSDNFGLMPYRRSIVSVCEHQHFQSQIDTEEQCVTVGRPIAVTKCEKPTAEMVMDVHAKYVAELTRCVYSLCLFCTSSSACLHDGQNMGQVQGRVRQATEKRAQDHVIGRVISKCIVGNPDTIEPSLKLTCHYGPSRR